MSDVQVRHPFLTADWRYLLLLNFRIDPSLLQPLVPAGTVLDEWQGTPWVSLVAFRFQRTRVLGIPIPGHRDFPEINLRFYVRSAEDAKPGVVFIREMVPRLAIVAVARTLYNEPYVRRPMHMQAPRDVREAPGTIAYRWMDDVRENRLGATPAGMSRPIAEGTEEEFMLVRHWGYTRQRDGSTYEYTVAHPRWRTWPVAEVVYDIDAIGSFGPELGEVLRQRPDSILLADGSAVRVSRPRRPPFAARRETLRSRAPS